ncbi:MAG TPA: molybdenum cofactor guanylyltransferase [Streptosporangiaceae bacterium]|jgi:molybdopterin-guanine dinucleotide biosynthesis protein A
MDPYDAIILAGGRGSRLGGVDKPGLLVGERPLITRVTTAVADARLVVVAGPWRPGLPGAEFVQEDPPGAGPVPALRAALPLVAAEWVALLAADLPYLTAGHVTQARRAAAAADGAVPVDAGGRAQWLAGVWRTTPLRTALAAYSGSSLGGLLGDLEQVRLRPAALDGEPVPWRDCDTPADLADARRWAAR